MLDSFEILTTAGVVLWSRAYVPVGVNVVNSLIRDVFIEDRSTNGATVANDTTAAHNPVYKKDKYSLKWTTAKDLGLIFVAVYQSLMQLSWIDKLLDNVKILFTSLYRDELSKEHTTIIQCPFNNYFDRQMQELEQMTGGYRTPSSELTPSKSLTPPSTSGSERGVNAPPPPIPDLRKASQKMTEMYNTSAEITPDPTPNSSRSASPATHLLAAKTTTAGRTSRRARRGAATSTSNSRNGSSVSTEQLQPRVTSKQMRKWDEDGMIDDGGERILDYSAAPGEGSINHVVNGSIDVVSHDDFGKKTLKGEVVLKDLGEEIDQILSSASDASLTVPTSANGGIVNSSISAITDLFRNVVGGKTLTKADLVKPIKATEEHLINKNVAREAALRLCDAVQRDLIGTKTASFQSIDATIRTSMEKALSKMLTPSTSLDLLRSIEAVTTKGRRPYVLSVVGVNGVGKSTTLAKLAYLLLHNNFRVLVCAADTFRSGAVEQLRVHVRNLRTLSSSSSNMGHIDLFERGYGKDAAHIARDAVAYASSPVGEEAPFDVVLIDTAGRRHNDARLMSSLEKFATLANPDKILMVGEALVGSDSVAQARHFNESFGLGRRLDGFIVSKCDTVGEMVGTLVSMVHATGVPIVALGVGQHYGDLRGLNVAWATRLLMQ